VRTNINAQDKRRNIMNDEIDKWCINEWQIKREIYERENIITDIINDEIDKWKTNSEAYKWMTNNERYNKWKRENIIA
jgi:hypothetical protein